MRAFAQQEVFILLNICQAPDPQLIVQTGPYRVRNITRPDPAPPARRTHSTLFLRQTAGSPARGKWFCSETDYPFNWWNKICHLWIYNNLWFADQTQFKSHNNSSWRICVLSAKQKALRLNCLPTIIVKAFVGFKIYNIWKRKWYDESGIPQN